MKTKKLAKLRYNMWFYFIVFAISLLAIVWLFQLLLFDRIYYNKKIETLENYGGNLSQMLNSDDINAEQLNLWLNTAVEANEAGIFPYLANYNNGELQIETIYSSFVGGANQASAKVDFELMANADSDKKELTDVQIVADAVYKLNADKNKKSICYRFDRNTAGLYVYASTVSNSLMKSGYLVLVTNRQSLVDTINIIQSQLIIISIFVVIVSFFISWYISAKLSRPIIEMSSTAKKWASGDENAVFASVNYLELSELCDALNYAKEGISQTGVLQRDLLANVSHDLKTPLTMIKAYAEMIRDLSGDIKEKRDLHTKVIIDEADRLTMLVNDILDLSRLQNKMAQLEVERVNLSELTLKVLMRFNDFMERNGYVIEKQIEPNLYADCDQKKIEQVIYNLVGNSLNYTGENKTIFVKLAKEGDTVLFETIDSGKGISEEKVTTIWEKYYRFADTHQRPIKGTGLGLSIVKTILEAHNLKFGVISKKDVGSNFFIQFKVSDSPLEESNIE